MSPEAWTIVGVILGGALTALTQVITDGIRRKHEHRTALLAARQTAYAEFLACMHHPVHVFSLEGIEVNVADEGSAAFALAERLTAAYTALVLVAPDDTCDAAGDLVDMVMSQVENQPQNDDDRRTDADRAGLPVAPEATTNFLQLAKRDLNIPMTRKPERVLPPVC